MPRRLQTVELRTQCLQQVDLDKDGAFSDAAGNQVVVNRMMGAQYGDLYGVAASAGLRYFETSTTFTTTGLSYLAEPVDHLSTIDTIERVTDSAGHLRRLRQLMPQERSVWAGRTGHARRWELADDRINLYPTPPAGDQYILRYIAQAPDLSTYADTDLIDVVNADGLSFMIWGSAVRFLGRIRSDVTLAVQEREAARARFQMWCTMRAFNDPPRNVVDDDDDDNPYCDGEYWYDR